MKKKIAVIACAAAMMFGAVGYIPQKALPDRVLLSSSAQIPGEDNCYLKIVPQNKEVRLNEKTPFDVYFKSYKPVVSMQFGFIVNGGYIDDGENEFIVDTESMEKLDFENWFYNGKISEEFYGKTNSYQFVGIDMDFNDVFIGDWVRLGTIMVTPTSDDLIISTTHLQLSDGVACYEGTIKKPVKEFNWTTIPAEVKVSKAVNRYPVVTTTVQGKQFRLSWEPVEGAEKYGLAVYSGGKWKVQDQISGYKTTYTSKKLQPGTYKAVLCAKINGEWDLTDLDSRAFTITIK